MRFLIYGEYAILGDDAIGTRHVVKVEVVFGQPEYTVARDQGIYLHTYDY